MRNQDTDIMATSKHEINKRGVELLGENQLSEAQEAFNACLQIDACFAPAYYNRALVRHNQGDHKGALNDINRFAHITKGGTPFSYALTGDILSCMGRYDEAELYYSIAIQSSPVGAFYYRRGVARCHMGDCVRGYDDILEASRQGCHEAQYLLSRMAAETNKQAMPAGCHSQQMEPSRQETIQ